MTQKLTKIETKPLAAVLASIEDQKANIAELCAKAATAEQELATLTATLDPDNESQLLDSAKLELKIKAINRQRDRADAGLRRHVLENVDDAADEAVCQLGEQLQHERSSAIETAKKSLAPFEGITGVEQRQRIVEALTGAIERQFERIGAQNRGLYPIDDRDESADLIAFAVDNGARVLARCEQFNAKGFLAFENA